MKIVYFRTPEFSVKPLEKIILSGKHEVVGVVCQPDRPVGRKAVMTPPPTKEFALKYGIRVFQYESVRKEGVEDLKKLNADAMVTCAYGQILSQEILDITKFGVFNIHASLLPKYRGASPIQYSIINGDDRTGITYMKTDVGMDTGDIIRQYETAIGESETYGELSDRLSALGAEHIVEILDEIESGKIELRKQNDEFSSIVKPLKKEDSIIDFSKNSKTVFNLVKGTNPWPIAHTLLNGKILKIYSVKLSEGSGLPGEVVVADDRLVVSCGAGAVEVLEIQEEGGKKMSAKAYLLGRKIKNGDVLGK